MFLLPSNNFLLPVSSSRFLFGLYAMIGCCSNTGLRFEFICNKYQCLLINCFTFGNVLLYVITKGILFQYFSLDLGASNAFLSVCGSRWNSVSKHFCLKPRFINDFFDTCRFLESSEVSVQTFFQAKGLTIWYTLYQWYSMSTGIV